MNHERRIIKYWSLTSRQDFETAEILFENKKYSHSLFFCHLSVEKLLKALIVQKTHVAPPLLHDLVRLAQKADIVLSSTIRDQLVEINSFNIQSRYDDYKLSFYKKAKKRFAAKYIAVTKEILTWLNTQL